MVALTERSSLPTGRVARLACKRQAVVVRCNGRTVPERQSTAQPLIVSGPGGSKTLGISSDNDAQNSPAAASARAQPEELQVPLPDVGDSSSRYTSSWSSWGFNNVISSFGLRRSAGAGTSTATSDVTSTGQRARDTVLIVPQTDAEKAGTSSSGGLTILRFRRSRANRVEQEDLHHPTESNHATLQLLRQRTRDGSRPGARTDGFKLGLVVEGGGMRGAVTGGALIGLLDLGMRDCFDAVYGSSAGAINATYFLSGQREGVDIYAENIAHRRFCDPGRLMKAGAGPVLDLDYLLYDVMRHQCPLDASAVLRSPIPLRIVASSLDRLGSVALGDFADEADLMACLKASANIPEIVGGPFEHRGERLVDAAVFEPVPFRAAIADGCTHVLALCSRPRPELGTWASYFSDVLGEAVKRAVLSPAYMRDAWAAEVELLTELGATQDEVLTWGLAQGSHELPCFAGAHVCPVYPGQGAKYAPVCIDPPTLRAGVAEGKRTVARALTPHVHMPSAARGGGAAVTTAQEDSCPATLA